MIKLGITGGIGSGKSTICQIFSILGIPVYESDSRSKGLMNHSPIIKQGIIELFGAESYDAQGELNRKMLAGLVFSQANLLQKLNQLVHPVVRQDFLNWAEKQSSPYVIQESAILFDSGFHSLMDKTLSVTAPEEQRIVRVMDRDRCTAKEVKDRIKNQMEESKRNTLADFIINNSEESLVIEQVLALDKTLRHG